MKKPRLFAKTVASVLTAALLLGSAVPVLAAAVPAAEPQAIFAKGENRDIYFSETATAETPASTPETASQSAEETASVSESAKEDTTSVVPEVPASETTDVASVVPEEKTTSEEPKEKEELSLDLDTDMNLLADSTGVRGFVERLYNLVMSRGSDTVGINYWTGLLTSGEKTAAQVAQFFFNSEEFLKKSLSDDDYLAILYRTMMGREPDGGGMAYWKDYLNSGLSRNFVLHNFVVLPEFTGICQQYGVTRGDFDLTEARDKNIELTRFLSRLYQNCMGRTADVGGLNFWAGRLLAKQDTGASVVDYFFSGPEFTAKKLNNEDFLRTAYRTLFGREADQGGFDYWMNIFKTGVSRKYILNQFVILTEFTNACQVAGIERGSITMTENRDKNLNVTAFVNRLYLNIFNRAGDEGGLNYNTGLLLAGNGALPIIGNMLTSAEFTGRALSDQDTVKIIYRALFNREADPAGLANYNAYLTRGVSPLYVLALLGPSAEFTQTCTNLGITAGTVTLTQPRDKNIDVTDVAMNAYTALIGKRPTTDALNNLCALILNDKSKAVDKLYELTLTVEFTARGLNARDYTAAVFQALCGRAAATSELNNWAGQLNPDNATTRKTLFFAIGSSATARAYLDPKLGSPDTADSKVRGIDVNSDNGTVDWTKVAAAGYKFAMIRAVVSTDGKATPTIDPYFYANVRAAKKAGLKVGAYIQSKGGTDAQVAAEALKGVEAIQTIEKENLRLDYPIAMSFEGFSLFPSLSKSTWSHLATYSMAILDQKGYYPCLYASADAFKNKFDMAAPDLKGYDLWVADWTNNENATMAYAGSMWQYSNKGSVPGVTGSCNLDISTKDFTTAIKNEAKNHL